jgi:hypothetical protein
MSDFRYMWFRRRPYFFEQDDRQAGNINSFHIVCLTTVTLSLSKRLPQSMRSSASSFTFQYSLFSLKSSSSCLRLHPRLSVTCLCSIFPSVTCFRRQFHSKIWPIQLSFFVLYEGYSSPPWLFLILNFSRDWFNLSGKSSIYGETKQSGKM